MMYVNDRTIMDWQKIVMKENIVSFQSKIEPIRYTIAYCVLHKDIKNPWFVMVKSTLDKRKVIKSKTFGLEGEYALVRQLQKLKRMGYTICPLG